MKVTTALLIAIGWGTLCGVMKIPDTFAILGGVVIGVFWIRSQNAHSS